MHLHFLETLQDNNYQLFWEQNPSKLLDLDNEELWSKAYLPADRTTEAQGSYEGKVIFKHVQIKLVLSNEPLMACGPLLDWLRDKRCIYSIDTFQDNLCVWRCLVICKRNAHGEKYKVEKRNCEVALNLAREYYRDNNLKKRMWSLQSMLPLMALQKSTMWISCCMNPRRTGATMQDLYGSYSMVRLGTKTTCPQ